MQAAFVKHTYEVVEILLSCTKKRSIAGREAAAWVILRSLCI